MTISTGQRCRKCRKKPRLERRVNSEGTVFCSDDCYDTFESSANDYDHPYIDDYETIRRIYIEWIQEYEDDLYRHQLYGKPQKEELTEDIDSILYSFHEYYRLEGMDGIFSAEIYNYLLAFEDLQNDIIHWKLDDKEFKKWNKVRQRKTAVFNTE